MTQFEMFVTEGNEKADDLARAGAMLGEGFMAEARAETMQQESEEVYMALQYAASFHCLVEEWKDSGPSRKKSGSSWKRRVRIQGIVQSGVRKQTGIDVCDVEEEASTQRFHKNVQDQNSRQKVWVNGERATWEVMTWSEEWTGRERF